MNILVSLDQNYLPQLKVLLTSLYINNPETPCQIFLMHRNIPETILNNLSNKLRQFHYELHPVSVDETLFTDAPTMKQYPQEMYYRLLARQLLPDQDILNALYSTRILPVDDILWNYDARNYNNYFIRSFGEADISCVMEHTSILHFCGKEKPWKPNYHRRFGVLYLHYMHMSKYYFGKNI